MSYSDDDDITIIQSLGTMDNVDGELNYPSQRISNSAPIPEFNFNFSGSHSTPTQHAQRPTESYHALTVAYGSLKQRFNDLQRRNIELEKKLQSMDYPELQSSRSSIEQDGSVSRAPPRPVRGGLIAHGASSSDPTLELEQENENLQKVNHLLEKKLREREKECVTLQSQLKDMEEICQQITSSTSHSPAAHLKDETQTDSAENDVEERDDDTEESETTTELAEKYAAMMRQIMSELSLSKATIEQQQQMIENLQASMSTPATPGASTVSVAGSGASGSQTESWEEVRRPAAVGARPKAIAAMRSVDPIQCTDEKPSEYYPSQIATCKPTSFSERVTTKDSAARSRGEPVHSARPKSVTAPILMRGHPEGQSRTKGRSLSSSTALDMSDFETALAGQDVPDSAQTGNDSVDHVDSALLPNRQDVFGRPCVDNSFQRVDTNLFSDSADDLYGNDTLTLASPQRSTELRRRQSERDSRSSQRLYEPVRQSWPVMNPSARQPPEGAALENRYRMGDKPRVPLPLNIDRNVDEPASSRSYDNAQHVNVNLLPDSAVADRVTREVHHYGVLNNDPLATSKPVASHNIFQEGHDLTVRLPPVQQAERMEDPKMCPLCHEQFPAAFAQTDFEDHVMQCLNTSSGENTLQDTGERRCPVCNSVFPLSAPQTEFEEHVNGHFDEPTSHFELVDTFGGPQVPPPS